ncbi:MAG TPA: hypothetical protein VGJ02_11060 [Pyrinomonadaceae bacterium]|jgi:hypothetical protein
MKRFSKLFLILSIGLIAVTGATAQKKDRDRDRDNNRQQQGERWRVRHNGRYYNVENNQADMLRAAIRSGYQQGFDAGRDAKKNRRRGSYSGLSMYREGTFGYTSGVDRSLYSYYFQQGFQRGWQDGYNSRYRYGREENGAAAILDTVVNTVLNLTRY